MQNTMFLVFGKPSWHFIFIDIAKNRSENWVVNDNINSGTISIYKIIK